MGQPVAAGAVMRFWAGVAFLDLDELPIIAKACDDAGYAGMMVSDHLVYPEVLSSKYPYTASGEPAWSPETPWPDAWVLIGALGALTRQLRFSTNIYVAGSRHPIITAKAVATASVLTHGRVSLGVGAGWMREEFELLGTTFDDRGRRLDELIDVLRALWGGGPVAWNGEHFSFPSLQMSPVPPSRIPVWVGGHSDPALRRAARNDGWIGNAYTPDDARSKLERLRSFRAEAGTLDRDDYEIVIGLLARPSLELYEEFAALGVTGLLCAPWIGGRSRGDAGGGSTAAVASAAAALDGKLTAIEEFADQFVRPLSN